MFICKRSNRGVNQIIELYTLVRPAPHVLGMNLTGFGDSRVTLVVKILKLEYVFFCNKLKSFFLLMSNI